MNWYNKFANKKDVILKGTLRQTNKGFVYLEISNNVIHGLFSLIKNDNDKIEKPPYFGKDKVGAHISVISDEELKEYNVKEIKELGQEFEFKLGEFKQTKPKGWKEMANVYFVEVDAPSLKTLRKSYGLPETYKGLNHEFHFTIGVEKRKNK